MVVVVRVWVGLMVIGLFLGDGGRGLMRVTVVMVWWCCFRFCCGLGGLISGHGVFVGSGCLWDVCGLLGGYGGKVGQGWLWGLSNPCDCCGGCGWQLRWGRGGFEGCFGVDVIVVVVEDGNTVDLKKKIRRGVQVLKLVWSSLSEMIIRTPNPLFSLSVLRFTAFPRQVFPQTLHFRLYSSPSSSAISSSFSETSNETAKTQTPSSFSETSNETAKTQTPSSSHHHPWPEWVAFVDRLKSQGYIHNADSTDLGYAEITTLKDPCISFARDRFDLFRNSSAYLTSLHTG
ncbi:NADH-quinone oxidoreductase subunit D [Bienertia sinuspersici]